MASYVYFIQANRSARAKQVCELDLEFLSTYFARTLTLSSSPVLHHPGPQHQPWRVSKLLECRKICTHSNTYVTCHRVDPSILEVRDPRRDNRPDYSDPRHRDFDGDGIPNYLDTDDDNDGIVDGLDPDDDNDGVPDTKKKNEDFDGDGIPNHLDDDDGNDGIPDEDDDDDDNDGVPDVEQKWRHYYYEEESDSTEDHDSIPDNTDDSDSVGIPDYSDADDDGDGIPDASLSRYRSRDSDFDGVPDYKDRDDDNDGIVDEEDDDDDNDGIPDHDDPDWDGDGDGIPRYLDDDEEDSAPKTIITPVFRFVTENGSMESSCSPPDLEPRPVHLLTDGNLHLASTYMPFIFPSRLNQPICIS